MLQRQLTLDVLVDPEDRRRELRLDVESGLTGADKHLAPTWFYDETGSRLFEEITRLPEYYPSRAERSILSRAAQEIAAVSGADTFVEIGSGTSEKTRLLLDALVTAGTLERVVLLDISTEVLAEAAEDIGRRYDVDVHAVVGDFRRHVGCLPRGGRQLWAFLGGTIGNLIPSERDELLSRIRRGLGSDGHLLLGTDLEKDHGRLVAAYDDAAGVTAAFNRNVLSVINRELDADFDPTLFEHRALWNEGERWIEMRLRAREAHSVRVGDLGLVIDFENAEEILTEVSAKFTPGRLARELADVGLSPRDAWRDERGDFLLTLAGVAGPPLGSVFEA